MALIFTLGSLSIASAVVSGVAASFIVTALYAHGIPVEGRSFALLRRRILRHLRAYRDMTKRQTGRVGPFYYVYVGSWLGMVVFGVIAILLRVAWSVVRG
ncbi:MAG: hypothetical protein PHX77_03115 [Candidatus Bipolaricaulis sp.]|nr:hypothetical protein [Candidatus Bipolaricaulis sp.]MDD5646937.1 hypothetical protein [Candidatus Bipolaricaulis sp.]